MEVTPDIIRAAVAAYYRYKRQCVIAFEAPPYKWSSDRSDILVIDNRRLIEVEIKVSISDFRKDKEKRKHDFINHDNYPAFQFYFAVPPTIANQVSFECDQLYPYAGVIRVASLSQNDVSIQRRARVLNIKKLPIRSIIDILKQQSGTLARLARDVALLKGKNFQFNPFL